MKAFSRSTIATVPQDHAPQGLRLPLAHPLAAGPWWLLATVLFSLVLYYFVGIDQGALSVFGNDMHIHEFAHDGRHVLAFPCH